MGFLGCDPSNYDGSRGVRAFVKGDCESVWAKFGSMEYYELWEFGGGSI